MHTEVAVPRTESLFEKDIISPELLSDVELAKSQIEKTGKAVLIKNQNAIMANSSELVRLMGSHLEGLTLPSQFLRSLSQALSEGKVDPNIAIVNTLIDHGVLARNVNQFSLSPEAAQKGAILVTPEDSTAEIAATLLHEKRHQKFFTQPDYKSQVLKKVDSLSPEQKTLGFILLAIPGGYDGLSTTTSGGEKFEKFATEIDAHASMMRDGFDVSSLTSNRKSDFKSSVKEVFQGLKKHFRDDKGFPENEIKLGLSLKFTGNKAYIRIEEQLFVIRADSKRQLNNEAGTIEVKDIPQK